MASSCCSSKKTNRIKQSINNLKSSIFCGTKGFLTFNLALLSYLEYSLYDNTVHTLQEKEYSIYVYGGTAHTLQKKKVKFAYAESTDGSFTAQGIEKNYKSKKGNSNQYGFFKERAVFTMKRNTIPLIEMITIVPFVCFALSTMIPGINLLQCALICAALMITTCFIVRTFNLREKLLEKTTNYSKDEIDKEFTKDSIIYPIFDKDSKHIRYNSPDKGKLLNETSNTSYLAAFLLFPLKVLQSCILLSLAAVELLEAVPNFLVDMCYDRSFESTKSNLQKSGYLLYASMRNIVPVLSRFDESVAEFIGTPKVACCGA